jgi:hypothetical protein
LGTQPRDTSGHNKLLDDCLQPLHVSLHRDQTPRHLAVHAISVVSGVSENAPACSSNFLFYLITCAPGCRTIAAGHWFCSGAGQGTPEPTLLADRVKICDDATGHRAQAGHVWRETLHRSLQIAEACGLDTAGNCSGSSDPGFRDATQAPAMGTSLTCSHRSGTGGAGNSGLPACQAPACGSGHHPGLAPMCAVESWMIQEALLTAPQAYQHSCGASHSRKHHEIIVVRLPPVPQRHGLGLRMAPCSNLFCCVAFMRRLLNSILKLPGAPERK